MPLRFHHPVAASYPETSTREKSPMLLSLLQRIPRSCRIALAVLWALAIPALSLLPARFFNRANAIVHFPHADKVVHAILYGVMTALLLWAARTPDLPTRTRRVWFVALAATAYGLLMEFLQSFTATRTMDLLDGLANAVGAFLVAGAAIGIARVRAGTKEARVTGKPQIDD